MLRLRSKTRLAAFAFAGLAALVALLAWSLTASAGEKKIRYVDIDPDVNDTSNLWEENGDPCTIGGVEYVACYDSIQDAIDASKDVGETVLVGPGKYTENIDIDVENLDVVSLYGPEVTLIAGDGGGGPTVDIWVDHVRFGDQPGTSYSGFTVFGPSQSESAGGS